jgi:hypothetical protein
VALRTNGRAAAFAGFALTIGYEDLFDEPVAPEAFGWHVRSGQWSLDSGELRGEPGEGDALIVKMHALDEYELVVATRAVQAGAPRLYAVYPAVRGEDVGPALLVERGERGWDAVWREAGEERRHRLPATFDPMQHQQWRFRRQGGQIEVAWESHLIGRFSAERGAAAAGLAACDGPALFEMVRATALPHHAGS